MRLQHVGVDESGLFVRSPLPVVEPVHEDTSLHGAVPGAPPGRARRPLEFQQLVQETTQIARPGSAPAAPGYVVHYSPQPLADGAQTPVHGTSRLNIASPEVQGTMEQVACNRLPGSA